MPDLSTKLSFVNAQSIHSISESIKFKAEKQNVSETTDRQHELTDVSLANELVAVPLRNFILVLLGDSVIYLERQLQVVQPFVLLLTGHTNCTLEFGVASAVY